MRKSVFGLVLGLAACAHIDTGQIDYRVAEPTPLAVATPPAAAATPAKSRLYRRYDQPVGGEVFKKGDLYAISIDQGAIGKQILEGMILGEELGNVAEIAILANVFEFSGVDQKDGSGRFIDYAVTPQFLAAPEQSKFKLVYYSNDIRRHQSFNFSNIPLIVASQYQGRSIGIQIVVMEIDSKSGPVSALMKKLVDFGVSSASLPPGVSSVVSALGQSIFDGGTKDDLLFDYRFVLSPAGRTGVGPYAVFRPGRYVVLRQRDRQTPIDWDALSIDQNTGRLFTGQRQFDSDLYLTLNIGKPSSAESAEYYEWRDFSQFRSAIDTEISARDASLEGVTTAVTKLAATQSSRSKQTTLSGLWSAAEASLDAYRALHILAAAGGVAPAPCTTIESADSRKEGLAERKAQADVRLFLSELAKALAEPAIQITAAGSTVTESAFTAADQSAVLDQVAGYFVPWDATFKEADFKTVAAFQAAFLAAGNLEALGDLATTKADAAADSATQCAILKKTNLAG